MKPLILPSESGVYSIRHKSGAEYIGSSNNLRRRVGYSLWSLRNNRHNSPDLQKLWNESKEEDWEYLVLKLCDVSEIIAQEQLHMDSSTFLLNLQKTAGKAAKGRKWSEESKQKARESRAKYLQDPDARRLLSERAKKQHAEGRLGSAVMTEESRRKQSEAASRQYTDPAARAKHSQRVSQQIADGNFGPNTWRNGPERVKNMSVKMQRK